MTQNAPFIMNWVFEKKIFLNKRAKAIFVFRILYGKINLQGESIDENAFKFDKRTLIIQKWCFSWSIVQMKHNYPKDFIQKHIWPVPLSAGNFFHSLARWCCWTKDCNSIRKTLCGYRKSWKFNIWSPKMIRS